MSLFKYLLLEECYLCLLWKTKALELSLGELHVILPPFSEKILILDNFISITFCFLC